MAELSRPNFLTAYKKQDRLSAHACRPVRVANGHGDAPLNKRLRKALSRIGQPKPSKTGIKMQFKAVTSKFVHIYICSFKFWQ